MGKTNKKYRSDEALSKNHSEKIAYRKRKQEEKEAEDELMHYIPPVIEGEEWVRIGLFRDDDL